MNKRILHIVNVFEKVLKQIPDIVYIGDPVLRKKSQQVPTEEGKKIGEKLIKILLQYRGITGYGRGLAAPQIGVSASVFVTYIDNKQQIYINPKITDKSKQTNYYRETCISCGIMSVDVKRPEWIALEWTNAEGKKCTEKFTEFGARLIQHEESHLRGIVNIDEAVPGSIEFATSDPLLEKLRSKRP